jgi:ABC transporter, permease/ATP-binding protein
MKDILKKYTGKIILVVLLLLVQAYCDLALPDYTSKIINVGIQQKGISSEVADVLTDKTFDNLSALDNKLKGYYEKVDKTDKNIKKYPYLKDGDVYKLIDSVSEDGKSEIVDATVIYSFLISNEQIKKSGIDINPTTIEYYTKSDTLNIKEYLDKFKDIDASMKKQYSINFISSEYKSLGIDLENLQMKYLFKTGTMMVLLSLFIMVVIILTTYLSGKIAAMFAFDLREKVVRKIMSFSKSEFNEFETSSLITRSTNDITQIQNMFTMVLRMVLYAPIIGIGALTKIISINMVWILGISIGAICLLMIILMLFGLPKFKIIQSLIDKLNLIVRETLNGLPVIRAFANEKKEIDKFDKANTDLKKVNLFTQRLMSLMSPLMMLIMNGTIILIYFVGAKLIDTGAMQVGTLTALISYTMQVIMSFLMLSMLSIMAPRAIISINRIKEVLNKENSIEESKNPVKLDSSRNGELEFKNVSFKYPDGDEYVLENVNFKINKGETLAIIGSTGSGKSTIVKLIDRFFDVTSGEILLNGTNIKDLSFQDLRSEIGLVPQKGMLFSGTVESNLKFGNDSLTEEEMINALKVSEAYEFVMNKEEKLLYPINQGGTNVSGGQRQRLCIARAVAMNPNIYVFDDSFSALDYKTDSKVRKNLNENCENSTKVIIAQRVATVMNADKILVLDEGKAVGLGTHKELYKNCKVYKEIALSQLSEEELA